MKQKAVQEEAGERPEKNGEVSRGILKKIAESSGVSVSTVSRVLNGQTSVAESTRLKVMETVRELGYVSPRIVNAKTDLIGVTALTLSGAFGDILAGVTEGLHARNVRPVICPIPMRHNCWMPLHERVMQGTTDGALLLGMTEVEDEVQALVQSGYPLVVVNPGRRLHSSIPVVAPDNESGAQMVIEHLVRLGHKHISVLLSEPWDASQERLSGVMTAFRLADLPPLTSEHIVQNTYLSEEEAYQATLKLLSLPQPPSAIFAMDDDLVIGVLRAAHERHLSVPEDLSVVGFNDKASSRASLPKITTVHQPLEEMGSMATDLLFRLIDRAASGLPLDAMQVKLSTRLVERDSTASPKAAH